MKKVANFLFIPVILMVAFTLFPTGSSSEEVLEGYQSTMTFARSNAAYLLYMSQFQAVQDADYDARYAGSIGEKIAAFAAELCEDFGNGGNTTYNDVDGRKVGQFRYSTSNTNGYASRDALMQSIQQMLSDTSKTSTISCCAFATFTWEALLNGRSPYGTGCTTTVSNNFQDIIEGDGTSQYIIDNAKPGDLLFYTTTGGSEPPIASKGNYKHAEVYIGAYSGVDARGTAYEIEYAAAGSNQSALRRDACIKPLETTVSGDSHPYVYMVSLAKWISSGNAPVDNVDQVETIEDIVGGRT